MITFPLSKINLGLNIVGRRDDGYHNLETVFYPLPLHDALEVVPMDVCFPSVTRCDLKVTGAAIDGDERQNLVVRAYDLLVKDNPVPRVHIHLYKEIPTQAGLGGGSSDGANMLVLLNELFSLRITNEELLAAATKLGADCPFFILGKPAYAEGIGEKLRPINLNLNGYYITIVKPNISVSTKEAFALVEPRPTTKKCRDIVAQPIETWRNELVNDFEQSVFKQHPELGRIKQQLYDLGAVYAAMSGSGSSLYGIFRERVNIDGLFTNCFTRVMAL